MRAISFSGVRWNGLVQFVLLILLSSRAFLLAQTDSTFEETVSPNRMATGRMITPAGTVLDHAGRPVDLELSADGRLLFVKAHQELWVVNAADGKLIQTIPIPDGASLYGIAASRSNRVYVTNSKNLLLVYALEESAEDGQPGLKLDHQIGLPADSFPCGIVLSENEKTAWVCLSKLNCIGLVDLESKSVTKQIPVGVAPFDLAITADSKLVVSNLGGRRAKEGDTTATSGGTDTVVDSRGIASTGTLSIVDLGTAEVEAEIPVGLHPSTLCLYDHRAVVCNTNEDTISIVDLPDRKVTNFDIKPDSKLPFGSMPSGVVTSPDRQLMFVALAGNNAVAVVDVADFAKPKVIGLVPAAWYPASLACSGTDLYIGNLKGIGARTPLRDIKEGWNSHDHRGLVQKVPLAEIRNPDVLANWTRSVHENGRLPQILRALVGPEQDDSASLEPIPQKLGNPSVFKHVIYVIKENRTFDQVFGDFKEARSDPALCVFPEQLTPNHHALARRFGILDNYYCNGVLSADGHSWATEGNVTPYLERAFGGFARSYTFGDDPITYSSSGFLWDHVLAAGLSFRNFGEMDYAEPPRGMSYREIYRDFTAGKAVQFAQQIGIDRLRKYSSRDYPGWNMEIPDVVRMDRFLKEFREFEKNDGLPSLCIVYLPQDHLGGSVVSRSHMADNDLAVGRLVDAVSHSDYWKDTVIFVNEDDPQNGYDHIDGHRSLCLVISAYSKPGVNHSFYNQTSVLRTILHVFGLPPMNQQDASMPLMRDCFQPTADLTAYVAIDANFPLDELPPKEQKQSSIEKKWRVILATVPIERTGMKTRQDEDNLNRFVWHEMRGWDMEYPAAWSGPHARGLKPLGLTLDRSDD